MMEVTIISREEAKSQGLKRYFTGKPCKHGHLSHRTTLDRNCVDCSNQKNRKYHSDNQKDILSRQRKYHKENSDVIYARKAQWNKDYPEFSRRNTAKRRAAQLLRTPKWADPDKILEVYKNCPLGFEVDHEIPLQGEFVSGLHVENNLRYLTPSDNRSKGNSFNW